MKKLHYAVLVPAHNESRTIAQVVRDTLTHAPVVIVVDDGSVDDTGPLAESAGALVLRNRRRRGLGSSLRRGLQYLRESGVQTVVTLDGDGVHDATYIPRLLRSHTRAGADLTIGTRFLRADTAATVPSAKLAANTFATLLVNSVLHCQLSDVASGMRVFGHAAMDLRFTSADFAISFEFIAAALKSGLILNEHPIKVRYDAEDLFCTAQRELLNLLAFAIVRAVDQPDLRKCIGQLRGLVRRYQPIRIMVKGRPMLLHPVKDYEGYAFQFQDPWYVSLSEDAQWLEIG